MVVPLTICPQPMSLQCLSILLLSANFSPSWQHTGFVSWILASS